MHCHHHNYWDDCNDIYGCRNCEEPCATVSSPVFGCINAPAAPGKRCCPNRSCYPFGRGGRGDCGCGCDCGCSPIMPLAEESNIVTVYDEPCNTFCNC